MPRKKKSKNAFGPELEALLLQAAKEAAGKPISDSLKPGSGSLLSKMIGRVVELAMEEEMTDHLGYEPNERLTRDQTDELGAHQRPNHRNGHFSKTVKTTQGPVEINVPRDRQGTFEPQALPKGKSLTKELEERIISMYTAGMSTRDIEEHFRDFYGAQANSQFISRVSSRVDKELVEWRNRPLEAVYAVMLVDAIFVKVRHSQGVKATAIYQVCAYNDDGQLEILGLYMPGDGQTGESASFWHKVFSELHSRGVADVLILCADGLEGIEKAARALWGELHFSPCVVHLVRASTKYVARQDREELCRDLKTIYQSASFEAAVTAQEAFGDKWHARYPKVVAQWEENVLALEGLWKFSAMLRKLIYTTNAIENVHNQQRKVLKTKRSLPSRDSALRLMTLLARKITAKNLARARTRPHWRKIVAELHIHFEGRIPSSWGFMYQ